MNILRGLLAGIIGTVLGFFVPTLLVSGYVLLKWGITGADEFDRRTDVIFWEDAMWLPLIGSAIQCGCAAWATYTPKGEYRFASTLAKVFTFSLIAGLWLAAFEPVFIQIMLLIGPFIVAFLLVLIRVPVPKREDKAADDPRGTNGEADMHDAAGAAIE